METHIELEDRVRREQRLRLASQSLEGARRERTRAILDAHQSGLSIRQIASASGLSPSRVHQILGSGDACDISRRLSHPLERDRSDRLHQGAAPSPPDLRVGLADERDALQLCREWMDRLDRGEKGLVNARFETDPETEYVSCDQRGLTRVLARIIAEIQKRAGFPPTSDEEEAYVEDAGVRRVRRRND